MQQGKRVSSSLQCLWCDCCAALVRTNKDTVTNQTWKWSVDASHFDILQGQWLFIFLNIKWTELRLYTWKQFNETLVAKRSSSLWQYKSMTINNIDYTNNQQTLWALIKYLTNLQRTLDAAVPQISKVLQWLPLLSKWGKSLDSYWMISSVAISTGKIVVPVVGNKS